jgi:hypothetical protein
LLQARLAIEKLADRPTGMTPNLPGDHLGLIESPMASPIRRRWCPGQHRAGSFPSDAVFQQHCQRRSKGSGRRPLTSIFEVGDEWA